MNMVLTSLVVAVRHPLCRMRSVSGRLGCHAWSTSTIPLGAAIPAARTTSPTRGVDEVKAASSLLRTKIECTQRRARARSGARVALAPRSRRAQTHRGVKLSTNLMPLTLGLAPLTKSREIPSERGEVDAQLAVHARRELGSRRSWASRNDTARFPRRPAFGDQVGHAASGGGERAGGRGVAADPRQGARAGRTRLGAERLEAHERPSECRARRSAA